MNVKFTKDDSIVDIIKKRIAYFKETADRYPYEKTGAVCRLRISTLEMILHDYETLQELKSKKAL